MKILAVDIGTGTQDIFLYDSQCDLENGYKLVLPSPTLIVRSRLRQATRLRQAVLLAGVTMGGGPSSWAVEAHLNAGLPVFALLEAARTINDDLEKIQAMGITLVSEDEALRLPETVQRIEMGDFNFPLIVHTLEQFSYPSTTWLPLQWRYSTTGMPPGAFPTGVSASTISTGASVLKTG
jgi:uncharacterized protein (DUF1786 family)